VDPLTVETTIARPRREVFAYLADVANHPEFTDHFMKDWHLTREDSYGLGAGARFKMDQPLNRFPWGDATIIQVDSPRLIVEAGRTGKFNRIRTLGVYELEQAASDTTRVRYTLQTEPKMPSDKLLERLGGRAWTRRKLKKAMRRLTTILEEGYGRGQRATIAGGPRKPATGAPFR
jgi:uncharacterized protein YndB with AHSA1/START domain